jgi:hypothetical protein
LVFFSSGYANDSIVSSQEEVIPSQKCESPIFSDLKIESKYSVGHEDYFWIYDTAISEYVEVFAKLLSVGQYCYFYVDNRTINAIGEAALTERCDEYAEEFDTVMYPVNLDFIGHPDGFIGDVDGDPKITILLTPSCYGGVYLYKDDDPTHPYSNEREMFYITPDRSDFYSIGTIIHEFNHLIWFNHEYDEAIFLLEGAAELSIYHAGYLNNQNYLMSGYIPSYNLTWESYRFKFHPERSLLYWDYSSTELTMASYGRAYMFALYLNERFGKDFIRDLVITPEDGPLGIEIALANRGYSLSFNDLYLNWVTACVIDQPNIFDGYYGYSTADFTIGKYTIIFELPHYSDEISHNLYGFDVKKIYNPPDELTFSIDNPNPYSLGIITIMKDVNGWSVTKALMTETTEQLQVLIDGEEIETLYIITSLMDPHTPSAASYLHSELTAAHKELQYSIVEGLITKKVSIRLKKQIPFILAPSLLLIVILKKRKHRSKFF